MFLFVLFLAAAVVDCRNPLNTMFSERPALTLPEDVKTDKGPLYITPMLENNQIGQARRLSRVKIYDPAMPQSFSGLITVNKLTQSNMFFWFFPASISNSISPKYPLILWLQGGPGGSSLYGLFVENGPVYVTKNLKLLPRKYSWAKTFSVLYIDNPVGTGFSYTRTTAGYATNESDVARDLYEFLTQFFVLFPELKEAEFYVAGESYAGKYVPAISYKIHVENQKNGTSHINLKGLAIGDGLCDPESMINYANFLYQIGLLDKKSRNFMFQKQENILQLIHNNNSADFLKAEEEWDELLNGDKTPYPSLFFNMTGFRNYFNFLHSEGDAAETYYEKYLNLKEVRDGIHVGNLPYNNGSVVETYLLGDLLKSVKPWVVKLLNATYKVLFYSGQLDIIVAYPLTENFLHSLDDWKLIKNYTIANRTIWKVNNEIAGYAKSVGNFTEVLVRNAGHMVPKDQPSWAFDLIHRFILGKPFR